MPATALIGLGSNLGDRAGRLDAALADLAATPGLALRAASSYHETPPVGGPPGQGPFLNAAAVVETALGPRELLDRLAAIEARSGRVRSGRWGERTLDLDLLLVDDLVLDEPGLQLPHPRMALRRFVLAPLAEVAPEARDPVTGRTVADLLANLDRRPSTLALPGWDRREDRTLLTRRLMSALDDIEPGWRIIHAIEAIEEGSGPTLRLEEAGESGEPAAPSLRPIPAIRVDLADPDRAVGDIVAACLATRAGS